jgi:hypothetical protein
MELALLSAVLNLQILLLGYLMVNCVERTQMELALLSAVLNLKILLLGYLLLNNQAQEPHILLPNPDWL